MPGSYIWFGWPRFSAWQVGSDTARSAVSEGSSVTSESKKWARWPILMPERRMSTAGLRHIWYWPARLSAHPLFIRYLLSNYLSISICLSASPTYLILALTNQHCHFDHMDMSAAVFGLGKLSGWVKNFHSVFSRGRVRLGWCDLSCNHLDAKVWVDLTRIDFMPTFKQVLNFYI